MFQLSTATLICLSGMAVAGFAAFDVESGTRLAHSETLDSLRCSVVTRELGHAVEISGKVTAQEEVNGDYTLRIRKASGSGDAIIHQSGAFSVSSGRTSTLGEATLSGTGGSYMADLELTVNGQILRCLGASTDSAI